MKKKIFLVIMILFLCGCSHPQCEYTKVTQTNCVRYETYIINGKVKLKPYYYTCEKTVCNYE